jgi:hypothetical protein
MGSNGKTIIILTEKLKGSADYSFLGVGKLTVTD